MEYCRLSTHRALRLGIAKASIASFLAVLPAVSIRGESPASSKVEVPAQQAAFCWNGDKQGWFVTALAEDAENRIWAGTEGNGIWRFDPKSSRNGWESFGTRDGFGDDSVYAIACDRYGRIWAGHRFSGVSVFDGEKWKNYDRISGPLGERVYSIRVSPRNGDVWIGTNAGITIFSEAERTWSHRGRWNGLPAVTITALAFDPDGRVYAGTDCDGVAIACPQDRYASWSLVTGPDTSPPTPAGEGLPSNLINDIQVSSDGTTWVATPSGIARSADQGRTWAHIRGVDWFDKNKNRKITTTRTSLTASALAEGLLIEDYVRRISFDTSGGVFLGHRQKGLARFQPGTGWCMASGEVVAAKRNALDFVHAMLPPSSGGMLVGWYGSGLGWVSSESIPSTPIASVVAQSIRSPSPARARPEPRGHPPEAGPPTSSELRTMLREMSGITSKARSSKEPMAVRLEDDWTTRGDWLGRYGRYWACLCAIRSPHDYFWGTGEKGIACHAAIGPQARPDDFLRHWIHWLFTDHPDSLELPTLYMKDQIDRGYAKGEKPRRQAEWDDHGETYPMTQDGPNLYCSLRIPAGDFVLSLYDFNKDGHSGPNRFRDYCVSVRLRPDGERDHELYDKSRLRDFPAWPELARARIFDFRGGVYKRFRIRGPCTLAVEVNRNHSFNTILCGVFLDLANETPPPYFHPFERWRDASAWTGWARLLSAGPAPSPARELLLRLDTMQDKSPVEWAGSVRPISATVARLERASGLLPTDPGALTAFYNLCLYTTWEDRQRTRLGITARDIEKKLTLSGALDPEGAGKFLIEQWVRANRDDKR